MPSKWRALHVDGARGLEHSRTKTVKAQKNAVLKFKNSFRFDYTVCILHDELLW
jgi:hypothetical protein